MLHVDRSVFTLQTYERNHQWEVWREIWSLATGAHYWRYYILEKYSVELQDHDPDVKSVRLSLNFKSEAIMFVFYFNLEFVKMFKNCVVIVGFLEKNI